MKSLFNF